MKVGMEPDEAVEVVARAARDLGLRRARLHYVAEGAGVTLATPRAGALRGALGSNVHATGAGALVPLGWTGEGPPALWFTGWHPARLAVDDRLDAGLSMVGACGAHWPLLLAALTSLRLSRGRLRLVGIDWVGGGQGLGWPDGGATGPRLDGPGPPLGSSGDRVVVVEARSPLQLRAADQPVRANPPLRVLVRSAGERLRQLHARWGGTGLDLAGAVGALVRAAPDVDGEPIAAERVVRAGRRASGGEHDQPIAGLVGVWRYPPVGPAASLLMVGTHLGVGKGTAFGCGALDMREA